MRIQALDLFYQAVMQLQMVLAPCSDLALSVDQFICRNTTRFGLKNLLHSIVKISCPLAKNLRKPSIEGAT